MVSVGSWFISPVLSGITSVIIFLIIREFILKKENPLESGLICLPIFYGFTILVNVFSIIHDGPKLLYMNNIPLWLAAVISLNVGVITMIIIWLAVVPWQRRKILNDINKEKQLNQVNFNIGGSPESSPEGSPKKSNRNSQLIERQLNAICENTEMKSLDNNKSTKYVFSLAANDQKNGYTPAATTNGNEMTTVESSITITADDINPTLSPNSSAVPLISNKSFAKKQNDEGICAIELAENPDLINDNKSVSKLFSFLQVLTAMFGSFAHGGNDVR